MARAKSPVQRSKQPKRLTQSHQTMPHGWRDQPSYWTTMPFAAELARKVRMQERRKWVSLTSLMGSSIMHAGQEIQER